MVKNSKRTAGFNESLDHGFYITEYTIELFPSTLKDLSALSQKYKIELQDYIGDLTFTETPINDAILFSE